jgi:cell division protease FtsH
MVTKYGMSERLGTVVYDTAHDEVFIGRSMAQARTYSEEVAGRIDEEIKAIIDNAYAQCEIILKNRMTELHRTAEYQLEHETMDAETFEKVFTDQWDGAPAPTQAQTAPDLPAPPAKEEHYDDRD